jgi:acylphosphatase
VITGRVQGVCFRASAVRFVETNHLDIKGYVKNLPNGDVEILAQGKEDDLDLLYEWLKHGPSLAKVLGVNIVKIDSFCNYDNFKIIY